MKKVFISLLMAILIFVCGFAVFGATNSKNVTSATTGTTESFISTSKVFIVNNGNYDDLNVRMYDIILPSLGNYITADCEFDENNICEVIIHRERDFRLYNGSELLFKSSSDAIYNRYISTKTFKVFNTLEEALNDNGEQESDETESTEVLPGTYGVQIIGDFTDWVWEEMTSDDDKTYMLTKNLAKGVYTFNLVEIDYLLYGSDSIIKDSAVDVQLDYENKTAITLDASGGDYTFIYNVLTHKLSVQYIGANTEPTDPSSETESTTPEEKNYTLFGVINGTPVGSESDRETVVEEYNFIDGKVTVEFTKESYVAVKTTDNKNWYMFNSHTEEMSGTLYNISTGTTEKMRVPVGTVEFTLVENGDGTLTLSYKVKENEQPDTLKNGIHADGDSLYYYVDNVVTGGIGLINIDGYYYYVTTSGLVVKDKIYYISKTNLLMPQGQYSFDAEGKMVNPPDIPEDVTIVEDVANDVVIKREAGVCYYYKDGEKVYGGLVLINGDYYYVNHEHKVITGMKYYISFTNGIKERGFYEFDETGKLIMAK